MATKARQQYFADETSLSKEKREFSIADEIQQKIDSIEPGAQVNKIETVKVNGTALVPDANKAVNIDVPEVIDNLYTVDSDNALSAKQGKLLYDYIQNIASRGRFLSNWNSATGLPMTNPSESPYPYKSGDYFVVSNVAGLGGTNYRPDGSSYIIGQASTVVETNTVDVSDFYFYDGTNWLLLKNSGRSGAVDSSLSTTSTNPVENRVITNAINGKANAIDANTKTFYLSSTSDLTNAQAAYDWYLAGKNPIIRISGYKYSFILEGNNSEPTYYLGFYGVNGGVYNGESDSSIEINPRLELRRSSDTVTSVVITWYDANVLFTDIDYSTPYTPQYDGSPATKKYVDDNAGKTYTAGANIQISAQDVISATDTKYTAGTGINIDANNVISNTQTSAEWGNITGTLSDQTDLQTALDAKQDDIVILKYGISTWSDFITAYNKNAVVYCRASSQANPASGAQTRLAFMAYVNQETNPTSVEFQYYRSRSDHNTQANQLDQVFVYTLTSASGGTWSVIERNTGAKAVAGTGVSLGWGSGNMTISADTTTLATKTDLNSKQDTISDLAAIRSGAGLGATALQPGDDVSELNNDAGYITNSYHDSTKQDTLVSGTNIKTINSNSLLGSGDLTLNDVKVSTTAPSSPIEGMVWYDTTNDELKVYDGTSWNATGKEYNAGPGIEIGTVQDYSAMRGPCLEGYHVPIDSERQSLIDTLTTTFGLTQNGTTVKTYLKMPYAGYLAQRTGATSSQGTVGYYWTCVGLSYNAYFITFNDSTLSVTSNPNVTGYNVRPFKDVPVKPNNSWTVLYDGSSVAIGAGVYHNSTLGLISISGDGENWTTIADKNLGATTVYNSGDTLSESNCGGYFQRGNNYAFPFTGATTTSGTKVDASSYGPGNYYSSSTFITINIKDSRNSTNNINLWGGETGVVTYDNAITNTGVLSVNGQTGNVTIEAFQLAPNSPLTPKYRRYGTQAQYEALTQYYTDEAGDTVYFTI